VLQRGSLAVNTTNIFRHNQFNITVLTLVLFEKKCCVDGKQNQIATIVMVVTN
jgi:hypothetical protein